MKMLDRRRRVAVIAGGVSPMAGGLFAFIHHGATPAQRPNYFLIGLSVGVTVGAKHRPRRPNLSMKTA